MTDLQRKVWEDIIEEVDKAEIPVSCLRRVTIKLNDGKRRTVNIAKMREQGLNDEEIEEALGIKFYQLHDEIKNVDFFVDTSAVANLVAPHTSQLLAGYFRD